MQVKAHQDVFGVKSGQTVDLDDATAKWAIKEGYVSTSAKQDPGIGPASVPAKMDPRLAENSDQKPNEDLYDQMDKGLGNHAKAEVDEDPVPAPALDNPDPVERYNSDGDPQKGAEGKDKLEQQAVKQSEQTTAREEQA